MIGKKRLVYWDSWAFIEWFDAKSPYSEAVHGLKEQVEEYKKGMLTICTSTITITEVLKQRNLSNPLVFQKFTGFIQRSDFHLSAVGYNIGLLAHEIRQHYSLSNKLPAGVTETLSTPDALHLATAIYEECDNFYTNDGEKKKDRPCPLIPLSGTIAGKYFLEIEAPKPSRNYQYSLDIIKSTDI